MPGKWHVHNHGSWAILGCCHAAFIISMKHRTICNPEPLTVAPSSTAGYQQRPMCTHAVIITIRKIDGGVLALRHPHAMLLLWAQACSCGQEIDETIRNAEWVHACACHQLAVMQRQTGQSRRRVHAEAAGAGSLPVIPRCIACDDCT